MDVGPCQLRARGAGALSVSFRVALSPDAALTIRRRYPANARVRFGSSSVAAGMGGKLTLAGPVEAGSCRT